MVIPKDGGDEKAVPSGGGEGSGDDEDSPKLPDLVSALLMYLFIIELFFYLEWIGRQVFRINMSVDNVAHHGC